VIIICLKLNPSVAVIGCIGLRLMTRFYPFSRSWYLYTIQICIEPKWIVHLTRINVSLKSWNLEMSRISDLFLQYHGGLL